MSNEETPILDRLVPYIGFFGGAAMAAGIMSIVLENNWHNEWLMLLGIVGLYFSEGWNRVMRRKQAHFRKLHLRDTARLCALDAHFGYDKVRAAYENSLEKTE